MVYRNYPKSKQLHILTGLEKEYAKMKNQGLSLDMSRGKPCSEQLDLSMNVLGVLDENSDTHAEDGVDCRNYGDMSGIPEAKRLLSHLMDVDPSAIFIGSGSSLNLMHDLVTYSWLFPLPGSDLPWSRQGGRIRFLCPSPGYDRHFAVSEHLGIENIFVPMTATGPDMDVIEKLVAADPLIKGMWCVPKYSNPTGVTFSDETVRRLASMPTAADDFRIFWDNAYAIHDLQEEGDRLLSLMDELKKQGNEDRAFIFSSFAKITFGGGGISAVAASQANMEYICRHMSMQLICTDKLNQLRHARYFKDENGLRAHMRKHAAILAPKFAAVQEIFQRELEDIGGISWTQPRGGYFISLDVLPGCAKRIISMCKDAGLLLTPAGATFPYGKDPHDSNIRIAPSFPDLEELRQASELLCVCVKIVSLQALLDAAPISCGA